MGLFRSALLACLVAGLTTVAQQPPGVADPNVPVPTPVVPQPTPTPEVDPNALQPAPATDIATPTATPPAKPAPKKAAAKKPAALPTLRGTVGMIDKTNMTIVVHGKSKDETLKITSNTRIFADNKPAILSDAKDGEDVLAEYRSGKDKKKEAVTLRFGKASAAAAPKKPAQTKKPAASPVDNAPAPTTPAPDTGVTPLPDTNTPPATVPDPSVPAPNPATP